MTKRVSNDGKERFLMRRVSNRRVGVLGGRRTLVA